MISLQVKYYVQLLSKLYNKIPLSLKNHLTGVSVIYIFISSYLMGYTYVITSEAIQILSTKSELKVVEGLMFRTREPLAANLTSVSTP